MDISIRFEGPRKSGRKLNTPFFVFPPAVPLRDLVVPEELWMVKLEGAYSTGGAATAAGGGGGSCMGD